MKILKIRHAVLMVILISIGIALATYVTRNNYRTRLSKCLTSARFIALSIHNYSDANRGCLFAVDQKRMVGTTQFGWRVASQAYIEGSPVRGSEEIRSSRAGVFDLGGNDRYEATIYAIVGSKTAFGADFRCSTSKIPGASLLLISGRMSDDPWFEAVDVEYSTLRNTQPIKETVGEVYPGITIAVFWDGEVWAVNSSTSSELFFKCAEVVDEYEAELRRVALGEFRIE